ncbi:hypothetical protein [Cellvibrio sp. OA-2007]|uniref:hypothetical protein n=1 Tax=Cellvibrio sp. OA-2007 TaxID=529823 RepID=UPI00078500E6|nr:hypothetical protein [Cellvibrio sp. OA-2007]
MATHTLIFYPDPYVGFNKTKLIERHLSLAGVIGARLKASSLFSAGHKFRQFIPKIDSIQKYQCDLIRIQIEAVGVWILMKEQPFIVDCSNVVLIEGDIVGDSLVRYRSLCDLLNKITGDVYCVGTVNEPVWQGISEYSADYMLSSAFKSISSPESNEKV